MKKSKKTTRKTKSRASKCLVTYVDNSSPCTRIFDTEALATQFIKEFKESSPHPNDGYWVDLLITDIKGEILFIDN